MFLSGLLTVLGGLTMLHDGQADDQEDCFKQAGYCFVDEYLDNAGPAVIPQVLRMVFPRMERASQSKVVGCGAKDKRI